MSVADGGAVRLSRRMYSSLHPRDDDRPFETKQNVSDNNNKNDNYLSTAAVTAVRRERWTNIARTRCVYNFTNTIDNGTEIIIILWLDHDN